MRPNALNISLLLLMAGALSVLSQNTRTILTKRYPGAGKIVNENAGSAAPGKELWQLPLNGLVGYWPFNGNANDESANGNDGLICGATLTKDRYGSEASAYLFSNSTDIIKIPDSSFSPLENDFTITFWFRSNYQGRMEPVNFNDSQQYNSNLNFAINDVIGCWTYWNSGGYYSIKSGTMGEFTDNMWHNLTFLRQGSDLKIYFDGLPGGTYENYDKAIGNKNGITIGAGLFPWYGEIDDMAIYNRALAQDEINSASHYYPSDIVVFSPYATDAFISGSNANIRWLSPAGTDTLMIEYSVDYGTTWNAIDDSVDAHAHSYTWTVPDLPGHECLIRITDIKNTTLSALSDTFLISKYKWQPVNMNAAFSIRDGAGAYTFNDTLFLMGGWNPTDPVNYPLVTNSEVWRSANGSDWELITTAPWEPRHTFGTLVFNGKMWVLGGDMIQCHFQTDVWNSEDGKNWNLISDSVPWGERTLHMYFVFDNKMWVMGGQKIVYCSNSEYKAYNDVWNSTDGIHWNLVTDSAAWSPRGQIEGGAIFKNKIWILGGGLYQEKYYSDVWNSTDGVNWNLVKEDTPWNGRQYHSVAVYDDALWVIGGAIGHTHANDVWYSRDGITWHELKGTPWQPRHASSTFHYKNQLLMAAGNMWNDVWSLNAINCPSISHQPSDLNITVENEAIFHTLYPTPAPSYQWQINTGMGWKNLADTGQYQGSAENILKLTGISKNDNKHLFRCLASEGTCRDTTRTVTLITCQPISFQPASQSTIIGKDASFTIHHPSPVASYQWQTNTGLGWQDLYDAGQYRGTTTDSLTVSAVSAANHAQLFRCIVSDGPCSDTSDKVSLISCQAISLQPSSLAILAGTTATFVTRHPGASASFQWQINNGTGWKNLSDTGQYAGSQGDSLFASSVSPENNGLLFRCLISEGTCRDTTVSVTLTICPHINLQPENQSIAVGETAAFVTRYPSSTASYQWQTDIGFGWQDLSQAGQYSGVASPTLIVSAISAGNNGQLFRCLVKNGSCQDTSDTASLTACQKISVQPSSQSTLTGATAVFIIQHPDTLASYSWQVNKGIGWKNLSDTGQYNGASDDTLFVSGISQENNGHLFRCLVSNATCRDTSQAASLTACPRLTQQPSNKSAFPGGTVQFTTLYPSSSAGYQWQANTGTGWQNLSQAAQYSGVSTGTLTVSGISTANNGQLYRCIILDASCTDTSNTALLTTCQGITSQPASQKALAGNSVSFIIRHPGISAAYQWQINQGFGWKNITNTGQYSGALNDILMISAVSVADNGSWFRCIVSEGTCHDTSLSVNLTACPRIELQPASQNILTGDTASFTCHYPSPAANYQWQTNTGTGWQNLSQAGQYSGVSTGTLTVSGITPANNAQLFRCLVKDTSCADTSQQALLTTLLSSVAGVETNNRFIAYPNPASEYITVEISRNIVGSSYTIMDLAGKHILAGRLEKETTVINIRELAPGIYILKMEGRHLHWLRLIKK